MPTPAEFENLRVVLVGARNPLNIGAVARAMSNFGFLHLRVVNPYSLPFREARSAVDASELLAQAEEFATVADAVADCALVIGTTAVGQRELHHPLHAFETAASLIRQQLPSGRVAMLFGSEKTGLSNDSLSHCHWLMRIPTRIEHRSMNLGQAAAICLYEIARASAPHQSSPIEHTAPPAEAQDLERITEVLLEALQESGYFNPAAAVRSDDKVRRLIRRLSLQADDAALLLGMLRQIVWKLRSGNASNNDISEEKSPPESR